MELSVRCQKDFKKVLGFRWVLVPHTRQEVVITSNNRKVRQNPWQYEKQWIVITLCSLLSAPLFVLLSFFFQTQFLEWKFLCCFELWKMFWTELKGYLNKPRLSFPSAFTMCSGCTVMSRPLSLSRSQNAAALSLMKEIISTLLTQ